MSSFVPLKKRLAIIVSHPVQYYAPLYQRLARRTDLEIKVFFTWHAGQAAVEDHGFKTPVVWDIPLTEGYEFELVPNISSKPGTDRFWGPLEQAINEMSKDQNKVRDMRRAAAKQSWLFDISRTEAALMVAAREVLGQ